MSSLFKRMSSEPKSIENVSSTSDIVSLCISDIITFLGKSAQTSQNTKYTHGPKMEFPSENNTIRNNRFVGATDIGDIKRIQGQQEKTSTSISTASNYLHGILTSLRTTKKRKKASSRGG